MVKIMVTLPTSQSFLHYSFPSTGYDNDNVFDDNDDNVFIVPGDFPSYHLFSSRYDNDNVNKNDLGIMTTEEVCVKYLKESNMMFVGGLIVAIAVEHCRLHQRIALKFLLFMGTFHSEPDHGQFFF